MTSNPASRRTRATSLAPRSWPSRPGLATSTRTGDGISEHHGLLELAPLVLEHVDHLADRAVRLRAVDEEGHEVLVVLGRGRRQRAERSLDVSGRTRALHIGQPLELADAPLLVELVALDVGRLSLGLELVDAEDGPLTRPHRSVDAERLLGYQALKDAVLDAPDHPALALEVVHDLDDTRLHGIGQGL